MNCPLHVLALVANGQELTEEQNMRYEHFCAYLVETVTAPMGTDDDETKRQSQAWMSDQGLEARGNGLVSFGYFQDMSKQALEECLSTDEFGYESRMQSEQQARKKKAHLTPYIRPAVSFVATDKPEWLRARDDAGRGRPRLDSAKMDSFVSKTPANIIAQQFAEQQTAAADAKREKKRGLQQHERCSTFWEAAHAGVSQSFCQCLFFHPSFTLSIRLSVLAFPCVSVIRFTHARFSMCLSFVSRTHAYVIMCLTR